MLIVQMSWKGHKLDGFGSLNMRIYSWRTASLEKHELTISRKAAETFRISEKKETLEGFSFKS
jgi:hypothetical protein